MQAMLLAMLGLVYVVPLATAATFDAHATDTHIRGAAPLALAPMLTLPDALQSGTFAQSIDHTGKLAGQTFNQRYWYNSEFAKGADAPILYHVCGESSVDGAYFLDDYVLEWAKVLGAHVVWLEHRYYGQSQPFADLSTAHLQYLTLNNILEDLATFQQSLAETQGWSGKWIALGGSYSATLAALYRQKHPELVVGALAASAPMIAGVGSATGTQLDVEQLKDTVITPDGSDRQWTYQACTELGYWQAEGAKRGAPLDLPSSWLCGQVFAGTPYVNSDAYNQTFDAPFLGNAANAPSNILFTEGEADVWTDIGLATQHSTNPGITILTIAGAGHHFDLNPPSSDDSPAVNDARTVFTQLATQWLQQ